MEAANSDIFKDKWVILDTNILSKLMREKQADKFRDVLGFLKQNNCPIYLIDSTYFEVLGFAGNKHDYDTLYRLINKFSVIGISKQDVETAILLSNFYKNLDTNINSKQISFCDCLHAAQLAKFKGRVFLITTDIYDYPVSIFDIKKLMVVEDKQKAVVVAFITYNEEKFKEAEKKFATSARL